MSMPFDLASANPTRLMTGNVDDDDAQIIDDLVTDTTILPDPPVVELLPQPELKDADPTTRLMAGFIALQPGWAPIQLVNEDARRTDLIIRVKCGATDYCYVADENSKMNDHAAGRMYDSDAFNFGSHTGTVWVSPGASAAAVNVSFWSTTR